MKRMLTALAVLVCLALPAVANATRSEPSGTPHLKAIPLFFTTHKATAGTGETLVSDFFCTGCSIDSLATHRVGTQIAVLCTTRAVSTEGWSYVANNALSDTSGFVCQLLVTDATGTATQTAMDSLYAAAQVSPDGLTWTSVNTFKTGARSSITSRLGHTNVDGLFMLALTQNGASLANGAPVWKFLYKQRAVSQWDGVEQGNLSGWPYIRWVIGFPDAGGYGVKAYVTHLTTDRY